MSGGSTTSEADSSGLTLEHAFPEGTAKFLNDELVVRLPYDRLVRDLLDRWSAQVEPTEPDDLIVAVGLCRIRFNAATARRALEEQHEDWCREAEDAARADGYTDGKGRVHDLEIVVRCLRLSFASEYGGWTPTIGKNRELERLRGSYVIDGGGGGQGPRPKPDYVIDGGGLGTPRPTPTSRLVKLRGRSSSARVRVGLVDTRIWPHPWLSGAVVADAEDVVQGRGSGSAAASPSPHATFVAGLILCQAPAAVVELRAALDDEASSDSWTVARRIAELADSSVELVNLSLGCLTEDAKPPLVLSAAMDALGPRTVVIAAAGNHAAPHGSQTAPPSYPAALDNVIAVGAWDGNKTADFSPGGPWVDAMAPGVDVTSTLGSPSEQTLFGTWSGTSFAAAVVTGAIADKLQEYGSATAAWQQLREEWPFDAQGRPVVPLRPLP
jgi:membrane-anchored mycosin MYCP